MKSIVFGLMTVLLSTSVFGQNPESRKMRAQEKRDKIEAQRAAFITTRLELSTEQSAKFWPAYNQMQEELKTVKKALKAEIKEMGKVEEMSNKDVKTMLEKQLAAEEKAVAVKRKYNEQFFNIIEAKQVAKLHKAEQEFKREVLREMKERKEDVERREMRERREHK